MTDHQDIVITQDAMENANMGFLFAQIKKWIQELDLYREVYYCLNIIITCNG